MPIEHELFDYDGWDGDPECMMFYNPVLKVQIGEFPVGSKFDCATIFQRENGAVLQFDNMGPEKEENGLAYAPAIPIAAFRLHYRIGEQLPLKTPECS